MPRSKLSCLISCALGGWIALSVGGCTLDVAGDRNDLYERERAGDGTVGTIDVVDGGAPGGGDSEWGTLDREGPMDAPRRITKVYVRTLDCNDPCPEPCSVDEICCRTTNRCVPIECQECCADAHAGHATVRPVGRRR